MSSDQSSYAAGTGIFVNGVGTATRTGTNRWALDLPGEQFPVELVTTPTSPTEGSYPVACTTVHQETGTFETTQLFESDGFLGFEGTRGHYTSTAYIVYARRPNGSCDTTGTPLSQTVSITAQATEAFAVL